MRAIQDLAPGHCRVAVEGATERAGALLLGMRAIALVLASPLADRRGEISTENADLPTHSAIGFLLALLDELTPDDAPVQWMRDDDRRRLPDDSDDANGGVA